jgi:hypothetical protein
VEVLGDRHLYLFSNSSLGIVLIHIKLLVAAIETSFGTLFSTCNALVKERQGAWADSLLIQLVSIGVMLFISDRFF